MELGSEVHRDLKVFQAPGDLRERMEPLVFQGSHLRGSQETQGQRVFKVSLACQGHGELKERRALQD